MCFDESRSKIRTKYITALGTKAINFTLRYLFRVTVAGFTVRFLVPDLSSFERFIATEVEKVKEKLMVELIVSSTHSTGLGVDSVNAA